MASAGAGESLLKVARRAGVELDAPCAGNGACGKCRVRVRTGEVDSPRTRHIPEAEHALGWRLACESRVAGDAVVEVPEAASAYRRGMKSTDLAASGEREIFSRAMDEIEAAGFPVGCGLFALQVTLDPPTLDDTLPDNERLARAIRAAVGVERVKLTYRALRSLARVLRENGFHARCVIEREGETAAVLDILPPEDAAPVAGLAVDLGTTSVSALLVNLEDGAILARASAGNGQIRYGADVINRILESCREGGSERLQTAVIDETLLPLIGELCAKAGVDPGRVYRACLAGNTTMNHLMLGLYADPVRTEPYIPSFLRSDDIPAAALHFGLHPDARLILAPNVGSYVGGDITAGCFASLMWNREELTLFVDLGTNGELVLGNSEFLLTCACSAGPAFEGGDISCGMRATNGAIDHVTIDADTMEPHYTVVGDVQRPAGICGSGIIDLAAALFKAGIIDGRGRIAREGTRIRRDEHGMARYILAAPEKAGGREISIDEADIDNFIRAKGAIFSATMTMLGSLGMEPGMLEKVYVAGGIGSGIDIENAIAIGMLPDIDRDRFQYVGNASLCGAYAMLTRAGCRDRVDELAASMTYLELSTEPGYMDAFVAACFLPHTDARLFPSRP